MNKASPALLSPDANSNEPRLAHMQAGILSGGIRRIFNSMDAVTTVLVITILLAGCFLWKYRQGVNVLRAQSQQLKTDMEGTLPKAGDLLFAPVQAMRGGIGDVPLLDPARKTLWVLFSVHCRVCMRELPSWEALKQSATADGAAVHFISLDSPRELKEVFGRDGQMEVDLAAKDLSRTLRLTTVPYYMVISPRGRVEWAHRGALSRADRDSLQARLREATPASGSN